MNTPNINNRPNAEEPIGRNRDIAARQRTGNAGRSEAPEETPRTAPDTENVDMTAVRPSRDTFQTTRDREFVVELTESIANTEAPVREEAVARARERVSEGYYNSREFMGNLATRLINTDRVT